VNHTLAYYTLLKFFVHIFLCVFDVYTLLDVSYHTLFHGVLQTDSSLKKNLKKNLIFFRAKPRRIPQSWAPITVSPRPHSLLTTFLLTTLYTRLTVLIFDEGGKPENPENMIVQHDIAE